MNVKKLASAPFLGLIFLYRTAISPFLPMACRFTPTCSEYAAESLTKYGVFKGGWKALKRILRCHPFSSGGFDPVE